MNTPVSCLVVDDEELARVLLAHYIGKTPSLQLIDTCSDALRAMSILHQRPVDLLFLDIQMPDLTGLDLLKALLHKPVVIFTTAYEQYAVEGYEMEAADYLLKPFSYERFTQAVARATAQIKLRNLQNPTSKAAELSAAKDYLLVKAEHRTHRIRFDDIRYIQGMREYVAFHLSEGRLLSLLSLKHLEEVLPADRFIRIHKSYIVAIRHIEIVEEEHLYVGGQRLPIGPNYAAELRKRLP